MSKLFKSIYKSFSANQVDEAALDRYALKMENRMDLNNNEVWGQLGYIESLDIFNAAIFASDLKKFDYGEIGYDRQLIKYIESITTGSNEVRIDYFGRELESFAIESVFSDIKFAGYHIYDYDGYHLDPTLVEVANHEFLTKINASDILAEVEERISEVKELVVKLKSYLIGKTQIRYLKVVLQSKSLSFYPVTSTIEIPLVYRLMEYWDIVGSLKKLGYLPANEKHQVNNSNFLMINDNEKKRSFRYPIVLN